MKGAKQLSTSRPPTGFLDCLRGLAAVYVLIHHALLWMHPGYQEGYLKHPEQYDLSQHALLIAFKMFRYGETAVIFFFVLSGFVIHLRYAGKFAAHKNPNYSEWLPFLWRRVKRLYPPLLVAIALTYAIDRIGMARGYAIYFGTTPYSVINLNVGVNHQFSTLAGNLLFLMQTYVPIWGTDAPLWSLKYEWWFYVIYPALWPLMRKSILRATLLLAILFGLSFYPAVWPVKLLRDVCGEMIVWWLGAMIAEIYVGRSSLKFRQIWTLVFVLPIAAIFSGVGYGVPHVIWGVGFAGLIASGFYWQESGGSLRPLDRLKFLGDCSYTLYVIHAPIVILASGWLMSRSPTGELPSSFLPAFCALGIVPIAYVIHLFVERPFVKRAAQPAPSPAIIEPDLQPAV